MLYTKQAAVDKAKEPNKGYGWCRITGMGRQLAPQERGREEIVDDFPVDKSIRKIFWPIRHSLDKHYKRL